jgi:hypothetical protein
VSSAASTRSALRRARRTSPRAARARRDDHLVAERDRDASVVGGNPCERVDARHLAFVPGDRRAGGDPLTCRHGLVELVDAPEERAELELPERLAQLARSGGARPSSAGSAAMSRSRCIVASSFAARA